MNPQLVYDSANNKVFLFGGLISQQSARGYTGEVWEYDSGKNRWVNLHPHGDIPPRDIVYASLAYDATWRRVIMLDKRVGASSITETRVYDPKTNTWTNMRPERQPPGDGWPILSYDPGRGKVMALEIFSRQPSQTWAYDYRSNNWTDLKPDGAPTAGLYAGAMSGEYLFHRVILFGGRDPSGHVGNRTWAYEAMTDRWEKLDVADTPPARFGASLAYDSSSKKLILFGGLNNPSATDISNVGQMADTWAFDPAKETWTQLHPPASPPARGLASMVYDSSHNRLVLYGGMGLGGHLNDTWAYEP